MKHKLTDEDVLKMRRLFWRQYYGEITSAEREALVNRIADRQTHLPVEESACHSSLSEIVLNKEMVLEARRINRLL